MDHFVYVLEDFHVNGILVELSLADHFSTGPNYDVEITQGTWALWCSFALHVTTYRTLCNMFDTTVLLLVNFDKHDTKNDGYMNFVNAKNEVLFIRKRSTTLQCEGRHDG